MSASVSDTIVSHQNLVNEAYFNKAQNHDTVLFAIDCSKRMFDRPGVVIDALNAACSMQKIKAITSPYDECGILLFGTEKQQNKNNCDHVYILHEIDRPNIKRVHELEVLVRQMTEFCQQNPGKQAWECPRWHQKFGRPVEYGQGSAFVNLAFVFGEITAQVLRDKSGKSTKLNKAARPGLKRVKLITCVDEPHENEKLAREVAIHRGHDLCRADGARLELLGVSGVFRFDVMKFYDMVLRDFQQDDADYQQYTGFTQFKQELESALQLRKAKDPKRSMASVTMAVTPKLRIGVQVYTLIIETKKPKYSFVNPDTMLSAKARTQWFIDNQKQVQSSFDAEDSGEDESADDSQSTTHNDAGTTATGKGEIAKKQEQEIKLMYAQQYGTERLLYTAEERLKIRNPLPKELHSIRILGFKPVEYLVDDYSVTHSQFVYPDEKNFAGSTRVFQALAKSMLKLGHFAVVEVQLRKQYMAKLAAMVAHDEQLDANGRQTRPPGLFLIKLPFTEDFRDIPVHTNSSSLQMDLSVADEDRQLLSQLMMSKHIKYEPLAYHNPQLQRHYVCIEALALDMKNIKSVAKDATIYTSSHTEVDLAKQLVKSLKFDQAPPSAAEKPVNASAAKKAKLSEAPPEDDVAIIERLRKINDHAKLSKCTVAELKEGARAAKIANPAKLKAALVEQLEAYFAPPQ